MGKDKNIYTSSAFILLLRKKHGLNLLDLMFITSLPIKSLYEIQKGRKQLGIDAYNKIKETLPDIPECDCDGSYNKEIK